MFEVHEGLFGAYAARHDLLGESAVLDPDPYAALAIAAAAARVAAVAEMVWGEVAVRGIDRRGSNRRMDRLERA